MKDRPTILILTSKTGGGHISLAEALRDQFAPDYHCEMTDPQPRFFHLHYRLVSRYALWLWAAEFQWCDTPRRALLAHTLFTPLVARSLATVLERTRPDLIITTYPFLTYEVMQVLQHLGQHIPLAMLFADPNGVHASWLTEQRAIALAPTRETYAQALGLGFAPSRTHLVGWPVRAQFYRPDTPEQRAAMLTSLGLQPDRFTVFLQGGGEGAAQFAHTVERVLASSSNIQVVLSAGTNQALLARFQQHPRLHALPFTREIAPFMAAADVVMGKAGPNMLFEAVTLGKPFIATTYIPGQEQSNLEFIRRYKLGWVALDTQKQERLLSTLASSNELQSSRASVDRYRCWNQQANQTLLPLIHDLLK